MSILTTTNRKQYTANGVQTIFPFDMRFFYDSDLIVYDYDPATKATTLKTISTDYSVSVIAGGNYRNGANITFSVAPLNAHLIIIVRIIPVTQPTDWVNYTDWQAEQLEDDLDRRAMVDQQILDSISRSISLPASDPDGINYTLPDVASRVGQAVLFDTNGGVVTGSIASGVPISAFMQTVNLSATAQNARSLLELPGYDLIVDSNAKLDLWRQAVAGQYKRVYIKAGTWTASGLAPSGSCMIDLAAAGTVEVQGEKGSLIQWSGNSSSPRYGLWRSASLADRGVEVFKGVNVSMTNAGSGTTYGWNACTNLINCSSIVVASGGAAGFASCKNLFACSALVTGATNTAGFSLCQDLTGCTADSNHYGFSGGIRLNNCFVDKSAGFVRDTRGFNTCQYLTNCSCSLDSSTSYSMGGYISCNYLNGCYSISKTSSGSGNAFGFSTCSCLNNCIADTQANDGALVGAFTGCTTVVGCRGVGINSGAGNGYGFSTCKKCQQDSPFSGSKTATYNACYADSGTANACADTAAGGYNS